MDERPGHPRLGLCVALFAIACQGLVVVRSGLSPATDLGLPQAIEMVPGTAFALIGAVVLARRGRHPVGVLLAIAGLLTAVNEAALAAAAWAAATGALGPARWAMVVSGVVSTAAPAVSVVLLPMVFPTGQPLPGPWRGLFRTAVGAIVLASAASALLPSRLEVEGRALGGNPLGVDALAGPLEVVATIAFVGGLLLFFPAWASLEVRRRRARGVERQQLRAFTLVFLVLGVVGVVLALLIALEALHLAPRTPEHVVDAAVLVPLTSIPVAIGAAILRYRLWDIDRIVSRTVTWSALSLVLVGLYAAPLAAVGAVTGKREVPDVVIAGATLAVAGVARPLHRRLQHVVDRRFNRARYDGETVGAAFGARLRDAVDVDVISRELRDVTLAALHPGSATVWVPSTPGVQGTVTRA